MVMYISGSNIGSGTQGFVTFWADACGTPDGTQISSAVGDPYNTLHNIPGGALNFTPQQLEIGIGIEVPYYTTEVWIKTTAETCPTCHGPIPVDTIWSTPTPIPTATPTPQPTNNATSTPTPQPTATPTPSMINYKVYDCNTGYEYNFPKTAYCSNGTLVAIPDPGFNIGDTVRFILASNSTTCASGAPTIHCGTINHTHYSSSHNATDAMLVSAAPSTGCTDINHCPQP
jgi:hypothetical protein